MNDTKEVLFEEYCKLCKHFSKDDCDDPCNECLSASYNIDSHKPVNFEEYKRRKDK